MRQIALYVRRNECSSEPVKAATAVGIAVLSVGTQRSTQILRCGNAGAQPVPRQRTQSGPGRQSRVAAEKRRVIVQTHIHRRASRREMAKVR